MTLLEYLNDHHKSLTESELKEIFRSLVMAVKHCHDNNIIHRDLKPENILVTVDQSTNKLKSVKLADLGLSCRLDQIDYDEVAGTRGYMAPELYIEDCQYGVKIDSWSLGVILFNIISGKMAFKGTKEEIIIQVVSSEPVFDKQIWSKYSPAAKALALSLLEKNPDQRYSV